MIKNDRQLAVSRRRAKDLRTARDELETTHPRSDLEQLQLDAVQSQLTDIDGEISEYEELTTNPPTTLVAESLRELPRCLIRARIARKLSHRILADRVGLKEQAIQRYEANDYAGASFDRLVEVADALGVVVRHEMTIQPEGASIAQMIGRLNQAGVSTKLLERRFIGHGSRARELDPARAQPMIDDLERVFGWSASDLGAPTGKLEPNIEPQLAASFKKPVNISDVGTRSYVVYAHYLASVASSTNPHVFQRPPESGLELRARLTDKGDLSLRRLLDFAWDSGIAVLPLQDSVGIHGAYWQFDDSAAVVIKQGMRTSSRWLFDLAHELGHAAEGSSGIIEDEDLDSDSETAANSYASDLLLGGRSEALMEAAVEAAGGDLARLKAATVLVAREEGVPVGILANTLAWRLSLQNEDWWATATALQTGEPDPWETCRDVFLERADLSALAEPDLRLLGAALEDEGDHDNVD